MAIRTAVILAGGPGSRMWPYNEVRNKCAIPVANVPNVRRLAESLHEMGILRLVVVLGPHPGSIRSALQGCAAEVAYVRQPPGAGTAGALLEAAAGLDDPRFLVLYGDLATTGANIKAVTNAGADSGGAVLWDDMPAGEGGLWHSITLDGDRVARIVGHDPDGVRRMCGAFVLERGILQHLESNPGLMRDVPVGGMPPLEPDLAQSINDWSADLIGVRAPDFVVDLDKPWHVLEANTLMARFQTAGLTENRIHPTARIHEGANIEGFIALGPDSYLGARVLVKGPLIAGADTRIDNGAILGGWNVIGVHSRVSDYCLLGPGSVIGSRCVVGHGAELDGAAFDGSFLYHYCEISGIVGASVDIGAATVCGTLRFDDGRARHQVIGRSEQPGVGANAAYFGDYSRTGVNAITMPGVKIGAYSCLGAGVVLYEDLPSRTLRLVRQETVDRPWGPERYGW